MSQSGVVRGVVSGAMRAPAPSVVGRLAGVVARWPDLFVGLTPGQRSAVVRSLAQSYGGGTLPTRSEVDDMVQYVVGEISDVEHARRRSCRATRTLGSAPGAPPALGSDLVLTSRPEAARNVGAR